MIKKLSLFAVAFATVCLILQAQNQDIRKGGGSGSGSTNYVALTNGWADHLLVTNGFNSLGSGVNSFIAVSNAVAGGTNSIAIGYNANASGSNSVVMGWGATNNNSEAAITIGPYALSSGADAIAIGNTAQATATTTLAIGSYAIASNLNSTAIGYSATTTETNQVVLGTAAEKVFSPGTYQAGQKTYTYVDATNVVLDARAATFHYVPVTNTCHVHFTNIFTGYSAIVHFVNAATYAITLNTNQFKCSGGTQPTFTATTNALDVLYVVSDPWGTNVIPTITANAHN